MYDKEATIRDPHSLSAPYAVDPAYSVNRTTPDKSGLSLFSTKKECPFWLYKWGDLEAWLFNRMRHEAFSTCVNVYQPGRFRTFNPVLYAKKSISLSSLPAALNCDIYFCGSVILQINNQITLHAKGPTVPQKCSLDILPYLKPGLNDCKVRIHNIVEVPTFLIRSGLLKTDFDWLVSSDEVIWDMPECLPFESEEQFPHREHLPEMLLSFKTLHRGVYDFGVELLGHPVITIRGQGDIDVHPGESVDEALDTHSGHREQIVPVVQVSTGIHEIKEKLALRYIHFTHGSEVQIDDVKLSTSIYPAQYRGAFACSDELLTRIWMHAAYTLRVCMRELFVDGIKRDRLPWVGDLYLAGLCNYYSFYEKHIVQYSLIALFGEEPETIDFNGIIDYSLLWVMALRDYLMHFGDVDFLQRIFPLFERLMQALETKLDKEGLLQSAAFNWVFIDWGNIEKNGYSSCLQMLNVMALEAASNIYRMNGKNDKVEEMCQKAHALRRKCNEMFWNEKRLVFVDNVVDKNQGTHVSRQANIFAILSGTANDIQKKVILNNLLLNKTVQPVGTPYMRTLEACALSQCGAINEMISMIRNYWGGMIDAGASTFWEAYDDSLSGKKHYGFYDRPYGKSLCHAWSAGPVFLLSRNAFGIRPIEPGWKRFAISFNSSDIRWMCTTIPTCQGDIGIDVDDKSVFVKIPKDTTLVLEADDAGTVQYSGPCVVEIKKKR